VDHNLLDSIAGIEVGTHDIFGSLYPVGGEINEFNVKAGMKSLVEAYFYWN
jgi:hypothetical protein